jgi:arginine repressor
MSDLRIATKYRSKKQCESRQILVRQIYVEHHAPTTTWLVEHLEEMGCPVSRTTVYRYIVADHNRYVRRNVPRLIRQNREERQVWATTVANNRWLFNRLVWSDEKL